MQLEIIMFHRLCEKFPKQRKVLTVLVLVDLTLQAVQRWNMQTVCYTEINHRWGGNSLQRQVCTSFAAFKLGLLRFCSPPRLSTRTWQVVLLFWILSAGVPPTSEEGRSCCLELCFEMGVLAQEVKHSITWVNCAFFNPLVTKTWQKLNRWI